MDETLLPKEATSATLTKDKQGTACVVKSGEKVEILSSGKYRMPDGSIISDISDCDLQSGSQLVYREEEPKEEKLIAIKREKPKPKIHKAETAVVLPTDTTPPIHDPTIPTIPVVESTLIPPTTGRDINPVNSGVIDPIVAGAIATAAIASVVSSVASSSTKVRRAKKMEDSQRSQDSQKREQKEKEEQTKCNSKSDGVKSSIAMTEEIINTSPANRIEIKEDKEFNKRVKVLNAEIIKLNKDIRSIEETLSKKK